MLTAGNPYIDLATQRAKEYANSQGLLNSTIAAGAGQRAAIESALPIAQQDAQTYFNQGLTNQQFRQNTQEFNARNAFDWASTKAGFQNSWNMLQSELASRKDLAALAVESDKSLQTMRNEGAEKIANINSASSLKSTEINARSAEERNTAQIEGNRILQKMRDESALDLADIEVQAKNLGLKQDILSDYLSQNMAIIANQATREFEIQTSEGLTAAQKGEALAILNESTADMVTALDEVTKIVSDGIGWDKLSGPQTPGPIPPPPAPVAAAPAPVVSAPAPVASAPAVSAPAPATPAASVVPTNFANYWANFMDQRG